MALTLCFKLTVFYINCYWRTQSTSIADDF